MINALWFSLKSSSVSRASRNAAVPIIPRTTEKKFLITTQAKFNFSSRSGIDGVRSAT